MSVLSGTMRRMATTTTREGILVSHTGVPLRRATTFRFTLDVNLEQHQHLLAHAGAARLAYNHHWPG